MDRAGIPVQVRVVADDERVLEFIASTDSVDRAGDRIDQNWDLKGFRKNPVFLWAHRYSELPIGKILRITVEKSGDKQFTKIAVRFIGPETYPFADTVYKMYRDGTLNAVSIGFIPLKRKELNDKEREEAGLGRWGEWYVKSELLEVSGVTVPMNREALETAVRGGIFKGLEQSEIDKLLETSDFEANVIKREANFTAIHKALDEIESEIHVEKTVSLEGVLLQLTDVLDKILVKFGPSDKSEEEEEDEDLEDEDLNVDLDSIDKDIEEELAKINTELSSLENKHAT